MLDPCRHEDDHWMIRHLERLPLGTSYPGVIERLTTIRRGAAERSKKSPVLYLDATGVGQPIADLLRQADIPVRPVIFTSGAAADRGQAVNYAGVRRTQRSRSR
jgi:hypothetical protein